MPRGLTNPRDRSTTFLPSLADELPTSGRRLRFLYDYAAHLRHEVGLGYFHGCVQAGNRSVDLYLTRRCPLPLLQECNKELSGRIEWIFLSFHSFMYYFYSLIGRRGLG
jgi:hypothetical protein